MIPRPFEYFAPRSMKEATALLRKFGPDAKVLAGGMSLIPLMKMRLDSPARIVDINRIPGLEYVKVVGRTLKIGALARHGDLQHSNVVRENAYLLAETASMIGDPQIRNIGTIGGSLSHCDPSGDWGAAILAMRGELTIQGPTKQRKMKIDDFLFDTFTPALRLGEILTEVSVPIPPARSGGAYMKLERNLGDFPTVGVAVQITIDAKDVCTSAGIGLTALGPKNLRAERAEKTLVGSTITPRRLEEASEAASEDARPSPDPLRGSA
ncbi:MAG: xanthine dehydrogenase family protein subunit M, partial [Thaumarchaeota archaeon]|nr:xanthine dehydrogenase family protein subunit M [Nitrososphaerota archaeon]